MGGGEDGGDGGEGGAGGCAGGLGGGGGVGGDGGGVGGYGGFSPVMLSAVSSEPLRSALARFASVKSMVEVPQE